MGGFGAFGKIPALGDFIRLNVNAGFVQVWDDWMQAGMLTAREALQDRWNDAYLSAPIWRFTMPAGVAGPTGMTGIVMASVDRVGRQYPLTLAASIEKTNVAMAHFANTPVFERLEHLALDMLDDDNSKDILTAALNGLVPTPADETQPTDLPFSGPIPIEHILAGQALALRLNPLDVIWSTVMDDDNRMMLTRGLPQERDMRALFDLHAPFWSFEDMAPVK